MRTGVLADEFGRRIPNDMFRGAVDRLDDSALVDRDDPFNRRLQNRPQPLLAVAQGRLRLPAFVAAFGLLHFVDGGLLVRLLDQLDAG